ncbi:MAG TPA: LysR family transcriptional regulator [Rhodobacteraceae bacterium]|jgi:LysR family transcriptional regulator of gallate degradation|nr:LysR family transcriptional regulator [Paracoccaceae bacterium]
MSKRPTSAPSVPRNLRHLRLFLAVAETGSVTDAAARCHVTQPAVTQALAKLELAIGATLFERTRQGFFATPQGVILAERIRRALARLDPALSDIAPRLTLTASLAQLQALVALRETENFTLAARRLGLAQPTVHRAITQLEQEAGRILFERTAFGMIASRQAKTLAQAMRLALTELDQAEAELADLNGEEAGRLVIGALPLSRSVLLPQAIVEFRAARPTYPVLILDGPYDELLSGLRRGDIDLILGALRDPSPIADVVQEPLFEDRLSILAGRNHPFAGRADLRREDLHRCGWVVPRRGTPSREQFDAFFADLGPPASIVEAGSILLMREILARSPLLGCISATQAQAEISHGLLAEVPVAARWTARAIGLTRRENWHPTKAQSQMLDILHRLARALAPKPHMK